MRKTKFWILGIILALIYSCSDDFGVKEQAPQGIDVSEARAYFEKHATDLAPLTFKNPLSRASSFVVPELIPEWDDAIESENEDYFITEVPLHSQSNAICVERVIKDAEFLCEKKILCQRRLVIARQKDSEETDMFVATLVPDDDFVGGEGTPFTGRVFYSELNGDFRKAVGYKEGQMQEPLLIGKALSFAVYTRKGAPLDYSTLTFQEGQTSRSATYSNSESGGGGWYPGWGGGGTGGGSIGGGGTGGGSTGGGTGGGGSGYDPDYELGQQYFQEITENIERGNIEATYVKRRGSTPIYDATSGFSIGINTASVLTSWVGFLNQPDVKVYAKNFGKVMGGLAAGISVFQTIVAFADPDVPDPDVWEVINTAVGVACFFCAFVPCLMPIMTGIGVLSSIVGIVSGMKYYSHASLIQVPLKNGGNVYVYFSAIMPSIA